MIKILDPNTTAVSPRVASSSALRSSQGLNLLGNELGSTRSPGTKVRHDMLAKSIQRPDYVRVWRSEVRPEDEVVVTQLLKL